VSIELDEWLAVINRDYLESFVPAGGASVKIVVEEDSPGTVASRLGDLARGQGFVVAHVDSAVTRVDKIDQVFCAIARQIDWRDLATAVRRNAVRSCGYVLPDLELSPLTFETIAAVNSVESHFVRIALEKWFTSSVFRDYGMSQDFRMAMSMLCFRPMESASPSDGGLLDNIVDWLRGDLRLISGVRTAQIYQRVARHNARDLLLSLAHWTRVAGKTGLLTTIDLRTAAVRSKAALPEGASTFYTRAAVMDLYEVLRQFIDATDEMEGCFIVAVAAPEFLTDEQRGLRIYKALELRVAEELRGTRDNPLATLTRIGGGAEHA
jgi:hypothetical protein